MFMFKNKPVTNIQEKRTIITNSLLNSSDNILLELKIKLQKTKSNVSIKRDSHSNTPTN